jgi:hypothetical protein
VEADRPRLKPRGRARRPNVGMNVGSAISGMQAASLLADSAALKIANVGAEPDADLAAHVTDLIMASIAYDANAQVVKTQNEVLGNAIDVLA